MYLQFSSVGGRIGGRMSPPLPIEEMQHYTYVHKRGDDGSIFYIGKGQDNRHISRKNRNRYWHNIVNKHGFTAEILSHWPTEDEAFEHEKLLIECFRDMGYKLANLTDGGEGPSGVVRSKEVRSGQSKRAKQQFASPEARALLSERAKQQFAPPEARARLREKAKQQFASPEARERLIENGKQALTSPDARVRHRENIKKYYASPEARAANRERQKQAYLSPELRAKRSEIAKQQFASPEARAAHSERQRKVFSSPELRAAVGERTRGRVWVNDGTISKLIRPDSIPEGFVRGRLAKKGVL